MSINLRKCPRCKEERSGDENLCGNCYWDLTQEPFVIPRQSSRTKAINSETLNDRKCVNSHVIDSNDVMCLICGSNIDENISCIAEVAQSIDIVADGWVVVEHGYVLDGCYEQFIVEKHERKGIFTHYQSNFNIDSSIYEILYRLPKDFVPEILAHGEFLGRGYDIIDLTYENNISTLLQTSVSVEHVKQIVKSLGRILAILEENGLRHGNIQSNNILVSNVDPINLMLTGFHHAILSNFDLDILTHKSSTRYSAPEINIGGVSISSDWWSLGMVILELITNGRCFSKTNEKAFIFHVLARGIDIPTDVDPVISMLLHGLLARDPVNRWRWHQVKKWLAGEYIEAPIHSEYEKIQKGPPIDLRNNSFFCSRIYALSAGQTESWEEGKEQVLRGTVLTWLEDCKVDPKTISGVRNAIALESISDDFKYALALMWMNSSLPLIFKGEIVNSVWLLSNAVQGYELITSPIVVHLKSMGRSPEICALNERIHRARERIAALGIEIIEDRFKVFALAYSRPNLERVWNKNRLLYPASDHRGINSLVERQHISDEDLIILLSATPNQYVSAEEILDNATTIAKQIDINHFNTADAQNWFKYSRRDLYREINERLINHSFCGYPRVDEWANDFRSECRIDLPRALVLLSIPRKDWREPPRQEYVATVLQFFEKRMILLAQRGPLVRMLISKSNSYVDLASILSNKPTASGILEHLVGRIESPIKINGSAFEKDPDLERRLRHIVSHAHNYMRDTGIDSLYLGFPFLIMHKGSFLSKKTNPNIVPILLWPVGVSLEKRHIFFDREREDVHLNPALAGIIGADEIKKWSEIATDLLGRSTLSIVDILDAFGTLEEIRDRSLSSLPLAKNYQIKAEERHVVCAAVIFHAKFMGQAIGADLRDLQRQDPANTGLATSIRVNQESKSYETLNDTIPVRDSYFTMARDPSQQKAVFNARSAPGLLVEGPPGTGKSQTIVNIIGDCIGRKQTALIVCQKATALEIIVKRLDAEGLRARFFYITNINKDRTSIIESLRSQLASLNTYTSITHYRSNRFSAERDAMAERIETLEMEIDKHHNALYACDDLTGLNYLKILGMLIELEDKGGVTIEVPKLRRLLCDLNEMQISVLQEKCSSVSHIWLESKYELSPLSKLKPFSTDIALIKDFTNNLKNFIEMERARQEVLESSKTLLDVEDPDPIRVWVDRHDNYFKSLDSAGFKLLSEWRELFRVDIMGGSLGQEAINSLIEMETELNIFKSNLTIFCKDEYHRDQISLQSLPGFDVDDPNVHRAWICEYSVLLSNLKCSDWKNISKWIDIFSNSTKGKSKKDRFIKELLDIKQQLESLNADDCDSSFSIKLVDTSKKLVDKWISIISVAIKPSFFGKFKLISYLRMRRAKSILSNLNEIQSENRMQVFLQAMLLEKKLRPLKTIVYKRLTELYPDIDLHNLSFIPELLEIVIKTIDAIEAASCAIKALSLCPRYVEANIVAKSGNPNSYIDLIAKYNAAFTREQARSTSYKSLELLKDSFADLWVIRFTKNISQNYSNITDIQPVIECFSSTLGSRENKIDFINDTFNLFAKDVNTDSTGCVLKRLRNNLLNILIRFYPNINQISPLISLGKLQQVVCTLLKELQLVNTGILAIEECPRRDDAEKLAWNGNYTYYEMIASYEEAFKRYQARSTSYTALHRLELEFDDAFYSYCYNNIQNNLIDILDVIDIVESLPCLSAYQKFRLRVSEFSPEIMNIFKILREKEAELHSYSPENLEEIIQHVIMCEACIAWKERIEQNFPVLSNTEKELSGKIKNLDEFSEKMLHLNQRLLASNIDVAKHNDPAFWEGITRLRGPRSKSLREIINMAWDMGLKELRPVWLVNPDTASLLLPLRAGMFDVVIFDEASQIPVENALPSLYRAKRVIISGDEKQMPPTNAFMKKQIDDDEEDLDDDLDDFANEAELTKLQDSHNRHEIKDCSDLLILGKTFLPKSMLQVHYRSKYRELIAFSNAAFYRGDLNVPARHPDNIIKKFRPIEVVRVDGIYSQQTNQEEAAKVVELLTDRWSYLDRPSIGVVTFNTKQANLIEDLLIDRIKDNPTLYKAYHEEIKRQNNGSDVGFFIKNVESVQGDERDLIIFSTTFGYNNEGKFRRNFGTLGQTGGERRLNVAITRACEKIILVTSMPINAISESLSKGQSPQNPCSYLQAYLDYATKISDGLLDNANISLCRMATVSPKFTLSPNLDKDRFIKSVAAFIKSLGLNPIVSNVHDVFGLDLVIEDPKKNQFGIGIECDSHCHGALNTAYFREIWRLNVIRMGIPCIYRISSYLWYHMRQEQMDKLAQYIEKTLCISSKQLQNSRDFMNTPGVEV